MSQLPGFRPIPFHLAGKVLLSIGIIGLIVFVISKISNRFSLPAGAMVFVLGLIIVSLYLIFVVPKEPR